MANCSLAIVERAYRGALEEQYANILWLVHVLRRMNGNVNVLLCGNAVRYAIRDQPHVTLTVGDIRLDSLPHYESEVRALVSSGGAVYVHTGDCERLNVRPERLLPEVIQVSPADLPNLFKDHNRIWYW
jgi:hypothetical protein